MIFIKHISYIYRLGCIVFLFIFSFASYGQLMIGSGANYGSDIEQIAPNLRLYYFPNHKICMGPEFAYFPNIKEGIVERQLTEYGFSAHFIFQLDEMVGLYPLLGVNYSIETEEVLDLHEETTTLGANLGGGMHLEFDRFFPFVEYKYVASALPQHVLSLGILVNLQKTKDETHHQ